MDSATVTCQLSGGGVPGGGANDGAETTPPTITTSPDQMQFEPPVELRLGSHWIAAHMYAVGVPPVVRQASQSSMSSDTCELGISSPLLLTKGRAINEVGVASAGAEFHDDTVPDTANNISVTKIQMRKDGVTPVIPADWKTTMAKPLNSATASSEMRTPPLHHAYKSDVVRQSKSGATATDISEGSTEMKILVTSRRPDSDVNLSPRSRRLRRLLAIHEKSQSMDAIFI